MGGGGEISSISWNPASSNPVVVQEVIIYPLVGVMNMYLVP